MTESTAPRRHRWYWRCALTVSAALCFLLGLVGILSMGGGLILLPAWGVGLWLLLLAYPAAMLICVLGVLACVAHALAGGWRLLSLLPAALAIVFAYGILRLSRRPAAGT
ncbi:MAG: hypothetical protein Q7V57_04110 [Actinomycetota bacterium]|nr:hypothetical protein [Actinomycetota bacterium]